MKELKTAVLMILVTTVLFGIMYPLVLTGIAQMIFPRHANGQLITSGGRVVGSRLIGQPFSSQGYFQSRPSACGYDAGASAGSNLGPTSRELIERVRATAAKLQDENRGAKVPIDLVTTSASGLDPHISPAAAEFQVARVARVRGVTEDEVRRLVAEHTEGRQFGFFGEPRVNVLELNLHLDTLWSLPESKH